MPAKKKSKSNAAKEELPDPASLPNGNSTVFVGGWSSYDAVDAITCVSKRVMQENTDADGQVASPLPRTNVLLLPSENEEKEGEEDDQPPYVVEVADQFFVEGISRHQCARAQSLVKKWAAPSEAAAQSAAPPPPQIPEQAEEEEKAAQPEMEVTNPYAESLNDERYTHAVLVGASYAARDVVVRGRCSIEGVVPNIVVTPQLPPKPDLDAVKLEPQSSDTAAPAADAGASAKTKKAAEAKGKAKKKSKTKYTPEQMEELERKKAELEEQYLQQTEEAVQRAREEADYLMTFAHPSRWVKVVFRHITFAGPVEVRRAHVSFHNCRFVGAGSASDRPLLLVSQYCRVQCTKCSFEEPQRCGLYALPSAHVEVRKCLFSGVQQDVLWAAQVPGVSPRVIGGAANAAAEADGGDEAAGHDGIPGEAVSPSRAVEDADGQRRAGAVAFPVPLTGPLKDAALSVWATRSAAVGVQADCAKLLVSGCDFFVLGVGVYVKGSYTAYVSQQSVPPTSVQQLTPESCDTILDGNSFHHFANTALLLDKSARLVFIRRSYVEACGYYGLDCQSGVNAILVRNNYFAPEALVRIREGATVAMLHNDFQSIPKDDNRRENPCLQAAY